MSHRIRTLRAFRATNQAASVSISTSPGLQMTFSIDPVRLYADIVSAHATAYLGALETPENTWVDIQNLSDTVGVDGNATDGLINWNKVDDPDDAGKKAFLCQVARRDSPGQSTQRTEFSIDSFDFGVQHNVEYWFALRLRLGLNIRNSGTLNEVLCMQMQERVPQILNPSMAIIARGGSATAQTFVTIRGDATNPPTRPTATVRTYTATSFTTPTWSTFVFNFRTGWTAGDGHFCKVWQDGVLFVDDTQVLDWFKTSVSDMTKSSYFKMGLYHYDETTWVDGDFHTAHFKGMRLYVDDGIITEPWVRAQIESY